MRSLWMSITKKKALGLLAGCLLLGGLLGGCVKTNVTVDVCGPSTRVQGPVDPGACRTPIQLQAGSDAYNFWNTETMAKITDHTHTCGGFKCQVTPGTCPDGVTPCKSWFKPSAPGSHTGSCYCQCTAP